MTVHINKPPMNITANGTTPVNTPYPQGDGYSNCDGIQIYNPSATVMCFAKSGPAGTVADATCQFIPPGQTKLFRKSPNDFVLSIVMGAAATDVIRATPEAGFNGIQ